MMFSRQLWRPAEGDERELGCPRTGKRLNALLRQPGPKEGPLVNWAARVTGQLLDVRGMLIAFSVCTSLNDAYLPLCGGNELASLWV